MSHFGKDLPISNRRGINGKIVLRPPKAQTEEPAQPPARETPRRDNNRDRRKDK
jgi:hypothetical protein